MTMKTLCSSRLLPGCNLQRVPIQSRRKWHGWLIVALIAGWMPAALHSQAPRTSASSYTKQQLIGIAAEMRDEAEKSGRRNNDALERHLDSATILAVRIRNGRAEFHSTSADEFVVLRGSAILVTGGTIVNPQGTAEIRGDSVQGGTRVKLKEGDVVHIPSKTPHQLLVNDGMFVYVLVKIQNAPA